MCVWDESSGKITFSDAVSIWAGMPRKRLKENLEKLTGIPCLADDEKRASVILTGSFPFGGTEAACICSLRLGRLQSIELQLTGGTADIQRGRLFGFIGKQDPCPDRMHSVRLGYPFGTAWITTDSRSGYAALRITYVVKE